jgi:nicotinamide-nucleotide amidase
MSASPRAEILTIGDELMRGEIVDSNKSFLSERLLGLDIETRHHTSVGDDSDDMIDAFRRAAGRSDYVLVSGGLGPTRDDLTAEKLAAAFGRALVLDAAALETIRAFFRGVGREMTPNNESQAYFPEAAEVLPNPIGTAPGFLLVEEGACFFCMPGVPRELYRMMDEQVLPRIAERYSGGRVVRSALLRTFGMGESTLDAELADIAASGEVSLGFRTAFPDNYLRAVARGDSAEAADASLARICAAIRERLGALVYAEGDETLEAVVGRLLREHGKTIAVAESCTGGLIAERITGIPGSSAYFLGGVVAYANSAKAALLGVSEAVLAEHGAVSESVARALAEGARERFGADFGVATTGISGPEGGSPAKPVGTVYVALARAEGTHCDHFVFPLDRTRHRQLSAQIGLDWVRRALLGEELVGPTLLRRKGGGPPPAQMAPRLDAEARRGLRETGEMGKARETRAKTDGAIRAFIAIELDDAVRRAAAEVVRVLRESPGGDHARWVRPENLHVTLRFLGDIDPARVPSIVRNLRDATAGLRPFQIRLGRVAAFPSARRPRVVSFEVGPGEPLAELAEAVEQSVVKAGFEPEERRFRAHLTLGRVSGRAHPAVTAPVTAMGESLVVNEIVLFRSELLRSGAIHTPLERIELGGSDHPETQSF